MLLLVRRLFSFLRSGIVALINDKFDNFLVILRFLSTTFFYTLPISLGGKRIILLGVFAYEFYQWICCVILENISLWILII